MTIWVDAQMLPIIAGWIAARYPVKASAVRDLALREANDEKIFQTAREAKAVVMTKDSDFAVLLEKHGPPPQVIWVTCGNTSNAYLIRVLERSLSSAIELINSGEPIVEIR